MKQIVLLFAVWLILVGCGPVAGNGEGAETAVPTPTTQSRGMGMMGMGGGMMARHNAPVPEEYAGLTSPIAADDESLARGQEIFTKYCVVCHGESGMGDGPGAANLDPQPAPVAHTSQMLGDDYLYWRISEGGAHDPFNSAMPAWQTAFEETARWDVINYVRALGSGQAMPAGMGMGMGSANSEAAQRADMLAQAVAQNVITQDEADLFDTIHALMDGIIAAGPPASGSMGQNQQKMLDDLLAAGTITQPQVDAFNDVHDRLLTAGLMQ
ncbi:MAG: cytochrome c [Chloroflexi bacterium]|nr:cytochrome c [Chloroflexota bacterium]MBP7041884.1 cytochrome c [Chloroflexota bacterium]